MKVLNAQDRNGKWIVLTISAYLAVERIVETGLTLSHGATAVNAIKLVAQMLLWLVNYMTKEWGFMPVGNTPEPLMFACETGGGDGVYDVQCRFAGEVPRVVSIVFIDDTTL
jgi:hypothetical protein